MGVVYLARDTKLERAVALKFLPPQWCHDEGAKQRFLREAQAASATNHRNICIIHDIAQMPDGQLFIVMAHYDGPTLKQKLEQRPLPASEAVEIAAEIAEGLAKAHAQGVVHRDIKPSNIVVTDDGVKILDFGLAKLADAALKLTLEGSTLGTVAYMSPEQARGEEADERSDLWALGVVLYEMLAGEPPFKGAYPEAVFYAIKNEDPAPLVGRGFEVPEALERVVVRALAKNPANRYQNAREMCRDLRQLQGRSMPIELRTEQLPEIQRAEGTRHPTKGRGQRAEGRGRRVAAAALVIALVAAGSYLWLARPLPRTTIAIVPVANHTGEEELNRYRLALTQSLISELSESPNLRVVPYERLLEPLRRYLGGSGDMSSREAIQLIARHTEAQLLILPTLTLQNGAWTASADIRNAQTNAIVSTVQVDPATSSLPKETAHRLMPPLADRVQAQFPVRWPHRVRARGASSQFRNLDAAQAFEEGINAVEQLEYSLALAAFRRTVELDSQRPIGHAWLSRTLLLMGDTRNAEAPARLAAQAVNAETARVEALFSAAVLADAQNNVDEAVDQYRRLRDLLPDDAAIQAEVADFLKRRGRNTEAIDAYHRVLAIDPSFTRVKVDLCQVYSRTDDYPLAEQHAQAAIKTFRELGNRGGEAQALLCLGEIRRAQGGSRLAEAREAIETARTIFESLRYQYGLSRVYQYLGATAFDSSDYLAAAKYVEEALSRSRQVGNRQIEALALMNLGVVYVALGDRPSALKYYQQAREFYQQMGDERRAAEQEINAASVLINAGSDRVEALRRLDVARATLRKLNAVEFDVFGMQLVGVNSVYAGDPAAGIRELRAALSMAKERHLSNRVLTVTLKLAEAAFLTGDLATARSLLEEVVASDAGRDDEEAHVLLARVFVRLKDPARAQLHADRAMSIISASGKKRMAPGAHLAMGEIAHLRGDLAVARQQFEMAAAFWTNDLPDAASVEAKCYQGMLLVRARRAPEGDALIREGIDQARRMGRRYLETSCRQQSARPSN